MGRRLNFSAGREYAGEAHSCVETDKAHDFISNAHIRPDIQLSSKDEAVTTTRSAASACRSATPTFFSSLFFPVGSLSSASAHPSSEYPT